MWVPLWPRPFRRPAAVWSLLTPKGEVIVNTDYCGFFHPTLTKVDIGVISYKSSEHFDMKMAI